MVGFGHFDDVGAGFSVVLDNLVVRLAFDAAAKILEAEIVTGRDEENLVGRDGS